jgi:hypothetical protein
MKTPSFFYSKCFAERIPQAGTDHPVSQIGASGKYRPTYGMGAESMLAV